MRGIDTKFVRGRFSLYLAVTWIVLTVAAAWTLLQIEITDAKKKVQAEISRLHSDMIDRTTLNEAVIEGFSAALRICPRGDPDPARQFASAMLARYPHIHMLGAAVPIDHPLRDHFETNLRARGHAGEIRWYDHQQTASWQKVPDQPRYWPIRMAEPEFEAGWTILGMDLNYTPVVRDVLARSFHSQESVAFATFDQLTGSASAPVIVLFRPVCEVVDHPCDSRNPLNVPRFIALLVVFADTLADCGSAAAQGVSCAIALRDRGVSEFTDELMPDELMSDEFTLLVQKEPHQTVSRFDRLLFPNIELSLNSETQAQPLLLQVSRQLDRSVVNLVPAYTLLILSTIGMLLALRFLHQRERSELARVQAFAALDKERAQLEIRVQERTQELFQTNTELEKENAARRQAESELQKKSQQLRLLARHLMDSQEQQNRTLARELHDDLGQTLTAIRIQAQLVRQQHLDPGHPSAQSAGTILDLAGHLSDAVHRVLRRLRPRALDELGLEKAVLASIEWMHLSKIGIRVHTDFSENLETLPEDVAITAYRLIQEALTNVARHSGAGNVWVTVKLKTQLHDVTGVAQETLHLCVEDDGRGMPQSGVAADRFGLLGAKERVKALGGFFAIAASAHGGVFLRIEIPLDGS